MNKIYFFFLIFYNFILINNQNKINQEEEKKLIFVYSHFRHGSRSPNYIDSKFEDYFGLKWDNQYELLSTGERMHYIIGIHNRFRYINELKFLSPKFDAHEIYVISSNYNRTINSALSQLQGLYPLYSGPDLNKTQQEFSSPPIKNMSKEIKEEIEKLNANNYSLPEKMGMFPYHIFQDKDYKFLTFDLPFCNDEVNKININNLNNNKDIKEILKYFDENYKSKLKKLFDDKNKKVNFTPLDYVNICDQLYSGIFDGRDFTFLKEYNIEEEQFLKDCKNFLSIFLFNYTFGDESKKVLHLTNSPVLIQLLFYIKKIVYSDINDIPINYKDFSNPKFVMISGHESTVGALELQLKEMFNISKFVQYPEYASNLVLEVYRINKEKKDFSDYVVEYYFNDEYIITINLKNFIDVVTDYIWSDDEVEKFCNFKIYKNKLKIKKYHLWLLIVIILVIISIFVNIFLILKCIKFYKENNIRIKNT